MSGCICSYAQENLRLRARSNFPTHSDKNSLTSEFGLPHGGIFTPSRGKSFFALTMSINAHNGEHLFLYLEKYFFIVRKKKSTAHIYSLYSLHPKKCMPSQGIT